MSRFADNFDDDYEYAVLDQGRWERNAHAALKGKRGRRALAELREALLALPEPRLIDGALCTVGGVDKRMPPPMTDDEFWQHAARAKESAVRMNYGDAAEFGYKSAEFAREDREEERRKLAEVIGSDGEGVCLIGAYLWHKRVKAGEDPAEAFGELPTVFGGDGEGDPLEETARLGEQAGLAFTLAWELAYRNDETYGSLTPEERYTAFLAWINAELGDQDAASSEAA